MGTERRAGRHDLSDVACYRRRYDLGAWLKMARPVPDARMSTQVVYEYAGCGVSGMAEVEAKHLPPLGLL